MRRGTVMVGLALAVVAAVAIGAAANGFGGEPSVRTRFQAGTPTADTPAPEGSGRPSTTGEDGRQSPSPSPEVSHSPKRHKRDTGGCPVGSHHRQVEGYLAELGGFGKVSVDGRQSRADCKAIKKFQRRYGISPANGRAGPVTAGVARRLVRTDLDACDTKGRMTVCLDLTHQTMWVVRGGKVVLGPTPVRTGRAGMTTPAGHYEITEKKPRPISSYYDVPLPYWQRFVADIGFHETPSYLHEGPGSHGCVNLLHSDAVSLWNLTSVGTPVHSFGRKPGT